MSEQKRCPDCGLLMSEPFPDVWVCGSCAVGKVALARRRRAA